MKMICRWLILLMVIMLVGCQNSAAEPSPKNDMPSLVFADRYALLIARHQYEQAQAVSTPQNIRLIKNEIIPFLKQLAVQNHKSRIDFKEVQFLSAQLINADENYVLVLEALVPTTPLRQGERVLLSYEVQKKHNQFLVASTHIRMDTGKNEKSRGLPPWPDPSARSKSP